MPRIAALLCAFLLLCGCSSSPVVGEETLTVTASTYPIYLLTCAVADGVDGVRVERLATGSVSCLHDYTLSVNDMKKIERADVLALNGAELEDFMSDALALSSAAVIDCSAGVELLPTSGHEDHDHEHDHHDHDHGHWDPHIWLDPANAALMAANLATGLAQADPAHADAYYSNAAQAAAQLSALDAELTALFSQATAHTDLITFHDGFAYFAHAYDLHLLRAIEEEAGSEASAKEIVAVSALVKEHDISVIFTEVNGSDATANAIARETGCSVARLTMLMDGPNVEGAEDLFAILNHYSDSLRANARAILSNTDHREVS